MGEQEEENEQGETNRHGESESRNATNRDILKTGNIVSELLIGEVLLADGASRHKTSRWSAADFAIFCAYFTLRPADD